MSLLWHEVITVHVPVLQISKMEPAICCEYCKSGEAEVSRGNYWEGKGKCVNYRNIAMSY